MRYAWTMLVLLLAGCSTHPIADMMDFACPGHMYANEVPPYGGVCGPQGAVMAPGLGCPPPPPLVLPMPPTAPAAPPGPPVVPPPVPLPGNTPAQPPAFPVPPMP